MTPESQNQPPTVLVVDDYTAALDVWELYLRGAGFLVLTATDGADALSLVNQQRPDLVVLDLELPGKSGVEVATILRAQESTRNIPLIAATGHSQVERLALARSAGFDAIVIKPCDPVLLLSEIRRLLAAAAERLSAGDGPSKQGLSA